jgi:hypothetical protein
MRTESEKSGLPYGDNTKFQEMNNYKNINNIHPLFNYNDYINHSKSKIYETSNSHYFCFYNKSFEFYMVVRTK